MDKSCSWVQGGQGAPAVLLRGVPIPLAAIFRQLGLDIAIGGSRITGPVLSRRLEVGRSALRRLPHLSTYDRRERAISTLVNAGATWSGHRVGDRTRPAGAGNRGHAGPVGSHAPVPGQGGYLHRPFQGATRLPGHAHAVRTAPPAGPSGPAAGGHPGLRPGYLGIGGPPSRDGPGGARAPHGGHRGLEPTRGLVVLGRPGARAPPALRAGAPPPAPKPGLGQPSLPFLAPA